MAWSCVTIIHSTYTTMFGILHWITCCVRDKNRDISSNFNAIYFKNMIRIATNSCLYINMDVDNRKQAITNMKTQCCAFYGYETYFPLIYHFLKIPEISNVAIYIWLRFISVDEKWKSKSLQTWNALILLTSVHFVLRTGH